MRVVLTKQLLTLCYVQMTRLADVDTEHKLVIIG